MSVSPKEYQEDVESAEMEARKHESEVCIQPAQKATRAAHLMLDALAAIIFGSSFAGFASDEPTRWTLTMASSLGVGLWGVFLLLSCYAWYWKQARLGSFLAWTRRLSMLGFFFSLVTAVLLTLGAASSCGPHWLAPFYHVTGFLGALLCLLVWCLLPRVVRPYVGEFLPENRHTRRVQWWAVLALSSVLAGAVVAFWLVFWKYAGNPDLDASYYPDHSTSLYKLPFPKGETSFVIQGNGGEFSHTGRDDYSWDFMRPCGTPVVASRAGVVDVVVDWNDGNCWTNWPDCTRGNFINILHDNGIRTSYWHHKRGTAMVNVGDRVEQGTPIALVGDVGYSVGPHIHFNVENAKEGYTMPVSFREMSSNVAGTPRALHFYRSGNGKP